MLQISPGVVIQFRGGRLFKGGCLFESKILGYLFNNHVSRVDAYSRFGAYSRGFVNRRITATMKTYI